MSKRRQWLAVYIDNEKDAVKLFEALHKLKAEIPSLDWDVETCDCEEEQ